MGEGLSDRAVVLALVALGIVLALAGDLLIVMASGVFAFSAVVRIFLGLALAVFTARGSRVARGLTVALTGLAGVYALFGVIWMRQSIPSQWLFPYAAIGVGNLVVSGGLLGLPAARRYFSGVRTDQLAASTERQQAHRADTARLESSRSA